MSACNGKKDVSVRLQTRVKAFGLKCCYTLCTTYIALNVDMLNLVFGLVKRVKVNKGIIMERLQVTLIFVKAPFLAHYPFNLLRYFR